MTCIVGVVGGDGAVWIGGDSAGVSVASLSLEVRADQKVFRNGEFALGFTSSFRMGQILRWRFEPPPVPEKVDAERYMSTDFVDGVRDALKRHGFARREHEVESGGTFLVGFRGRLFCVADDYQVGHYPFGFMAVGCGDHLALGALCILPEAMPPEDRIREALAAATRFSAGVRPPYHIVHTDPLEASHG